MDKKTNRLIKEKSPYLLQHAYNPVEWYPWGEEAFSRARAEDKPVYNTCDQCQVIKVIGFDPAFIQVMQDFSLIEIGK